MIYCVNGTFIDEKKAVISVNDNGFLYGDGFYETMGTYSGVILDFDLHMERLEKSAKVMDIPLPWTRTQISTWIRKISVVNRLDRARIRATVTRGSHGFNFFGAKHPTLVISCEPLLVDHRVYTHGVSADTMEQKRILPSIKTLGLTNMFVAYRLSKSKAYEMICTDALGNVLEGASTNVFIVRKGQVWTPKTDMLPGLARHRVIALARELGLTLTVRDFKKSFLQKADEIFLTNCTREIIPIVRLDGKKIGSGKPGSVTRRLMETYQDYIAVYTSKNGSK